MTMQETGSFGREKEGWADRGSVVREAQRSATGMLRRLVLGLSFPGIWEKGEKDLFPCC
jgi:hypothetical protein